MDNPAIYSKSGYLNEDFHLFHLNDSLGNDMDYHYHEFEKIVVFISGRVNYIIEGVTYPLQPWDVLFVGEHLIHRAVVDTSVPYERIILYVNTAFMRQSSTPKGDLLSCFEAAKDRGCCLMRPQAAGQAALSRALAELEGAVSSTEFGADILSKALFLRCAVLLNRMMLSDSTAADDFCRQDPKISDVLNYINANLSADLSIESLAARSYMSKYHFMRRFKELTGYTVHNYILQKRLIYASELIRDGMAVTQAALQSGFGDYSSFLRAFKKLFGTTPGKVSVQRQT